MMYSEFTRKVIEYQNMWGNKWNQPSIEEYQTLIEPVYNYHPLQLNKDEIATLFCIGGLPLFDDLYLVAMDYQDYEDNYNEAKAAWDKAQSEWEQALSKYCNKR